MTLRVWLFALLLCFGPALGQESVDIELPRTLQVTITDVREAVVGLPVTLRFSELQVAGGRRLRILVRAVNVEPPDSGLDAIPIPACRLLLHNPIHGTSPGQITLSPTFSTVFESTPGCQDGSVQVQLSVEPVGGGRFAGIHRVGLEWLLQGVGP